MPDEPLSSPQAYEAYLYGLGERYPFVQRSTLVYIPSGALFGRVEGIVFFEGRIVLCVREYLNFELGVIEGYGYEVSRARAPQGSAGHPGRRRVLPGVLSPQGEALLVRLVSPPH